MSDAFRQISRSCAIIALVAGMSGPVPALAQDDAYATPPDFTQMVSEKLPAVVGILSTQEVPSAPAQQAPQLPPGFEEFFGMPSPERAPQGPMQAQGSGFIISEDGYIVTNNHVIAGATEIEVVLEDERQFTAQLIGTDPATDIALLKVDTDSSLPFVTWGTSDDLEIGQWLVAIGNPFGLGGTVTAGILSARSRNINSGPYDDFLQTDAAINRGNSGGPLFDATGNVIGVNTAIFSPTGGSVGIGFAVPSQVAQRIVDDLRDDGMVERGWLGVGIQNVSEDIAAAVGLDAAAGAMITSVSPDSPAARAGLQVGDIITGIAGEDVASPRELTFAVADATVGSTADLSLWRNGTRETVSVQIEQRPGSQTASSSEMMSDPESNTPQLGVSIAVVDAEIREMLNIGPDIEGLAIIGVEPQSPAAQANLRRGDVIVAAGNSDIRTLETLREAIEAAVEQERPILLRIYRGGAFTFIAVPITP